MTVIQSKYDPFGPDDAICSMCDEKASPPFVFYSVAGDLNICSKCVDTALVLLTAAKNTNGLLADVIQLRAVRDLHDAYPGLTLKRVGVSEMEARDKRESAELSRRGA
jgi:hypothetical protein